MDYGTEERDMRIAEIGQLILAGPDTREEALAKLSELRIDHGRSFNNYAGHLAEYLLATPASVLDEKPWAQVFIDEIIGMGVKVRPSRRAMAH